MTISNFNKKIFALLLDRAKGERSLRRYAADCDISYVQLRKLALCEQDNPPRMKLIEKLGAHSENDVATEDFAFAAGYGMASCGKRIVSSSIYQKYAALDARQRREAEEFVDYLLFLSEKNKKRKSDK